MKLGLSVVFVSVKYAYGGFVNFLFGKITSAIDCSFL
jgi:hypothetical protein